MNSIPVKDFKHYLGNIVKCVRAKERADPEPEFLAGDVMRRLRFRAARAK
jgi:hypothetical protein